MTHYLRNRHDAILIGVGTAIADDPGLNCRLNACPLAEQPIPIVLDPRGRWDVHQDSRVVRTAKEGRGKGVWVLVGEGVEYDGERRRVVEEVGGRVVSVSLTADGRMAWRDILEVIAEKAGVRSVMVEGGGGVIRDLYEEGNQPLISSVIITIAPVYLGEGEVSVTPRKREGEGERVPAVRFKDVAWRQMGDDVVFFGKI